MSMLRTVDRLEALQALQWGSVILDRNEHAWQQDVFGAWGGAGDDYHYPHEQFIAAITGPYTVIWEPA